MEAEFEGTRFEWDDDKAQVNISNHGVDFFEAVTVFGDSVSVIYKDDEHSADERRLLTIGMSARNRILIVSYTERDDTEGDSRI